MAAERFGAGFASRSTFFSSAATRFSSIASSLTRFARSSTRFVRPEPASKIRCAAGMYFPTTVAVGSSATPTPTGSYYVNQRLIPTDTSGPFGPGAIGISAFSNVLTGWAQGGPIAIHGTNEPWSIGHAVSNGCIRLPNATLVQVFREAVAGTPVIIRA